jgi:hypothetical protein
LKAIASRRGSRTVQGALSLLLGLSSLACGPTSTEVDTSASTEVDASARPAAGGVVLARIGDDVITTEDLGPLPPRAIPANRLDVLIRRRLAIIEARRRGLENEPKVKAAIEELHRNALNQEEGLLRNALFNSIRLGLTVTEEELLAHYEATKERYLERQWALRMQGFENEDAALAANAALGTSGRLDPAQSDAPGPLPSDKLPRGVLPILHELVQPGDRRVLPLDRWTIVELEAYLPAAQLSFEAVRPKVELSLRAIRAEEQLRAELERVRKEMNVTVDEAALAAWAATKPDEPATPPAATPPAAAPVDAAAPTP